MPKFKPTILIQDCWSSIGDITFYHRNGQCYWKRKPKPAFNDTPARLDQAQVHHRAILAWQQLQHSVQLKWSKLAKFVPSHRPPFDNHHHISGYNLFVSAYHGFVQLGREHVPVPQPFPLFPPSALELLEIVSGTSPDILSLRCRLYLAGTDNPERWNISARIQLTAQGVGCDPSKMRTYMGIRNARNLIVFNIPRPNMEVYHAHIRYRLIDSVTGYRNNWHKLSNTI